ncbi:MAG: hypothetical protein J6S92_01540, partial [Oscillospiraceae bacterium]|nr:hypothetical protein [Oscillospiraceae bacterium]
MKKLLSFLSATVLAATTLLTSDLLTPAQEVKALDQVKIMPVGDSITFGYGDEGGYRKFLNVFLKEKNIAFDMVGPEG